jgi:hypothetical protein
MLLLQWLYMCTYITKAQWWCQAAKLLCTHHTGLRCGAGGQLTIILFGDFLLWGQLANKSCTILKSHFSATEWFIIYLLECKFVSVVKPLCNQYLYVSGVKLKLQLMSECITTYIKEAWLLLVLRRDNFPINICLGRVKFWQILHPSFCGVKWSMLLQNCSKV